MNDTAMRKAPNSELETAEVTRGFTATPRVDIVETENELLLYADIPGVAQDSVDIRFEQGELTIHGRRMTKRSASGYVFREAQPQDYFRSFRISEQVDASKISAELKDGVLTLHLPKTERVKPRKIAVTSKNLGTG
jgi:HSP20 family protein